MHRRAFLASSLAAGMIAAPAAASGADECAVAGAKARLVVLTDIGNEPDDAESLIRLLLYANDIQIEGLFATTSTWLRDRINPHLIEERVRAYGEVLPNLRRHADGWPDMDTLLSTIRSGSRDYGMAGVGPGKDTEASRAIVEIVDRPDARPVWIALWGGAVDLAQALDSVRRTRSPAELAAFIQKIRVYSISDQDDAGPWTRVNFPDLFWIVSLHGFGQYALATWNGISGDLRQPMPGADTRLVDRAWQEANIIGKGPLGDLYPRSVFIMEGDTPSFLNLIPNGLNVPERPDYGGWGGRYTRLSPRYDLFSDAIDTVVGADGRSHASNHATIWRWREAFQNDFAARMLWSVTSDVGAAPHPPVVLLNDVGGHDPVCLTAKSRETVHLTARGSRDPDGGALSLKWLHYREATDAVFVPPLRLSSEDGETTSFVAPAVRSLSRFHVVIEGRTGGAAPLHRYRRAVVTVTP